MEKNRIGLLNHWVIHLPSLFDAPGTEAKASEKQQFLLTDLEFYTFNTDRGDNMCEQ